MLNEAQTSVNKQTTDKQNQTRAGRTTSLCGIYWNGALCSSMARRFRPNTDWRLAAIQSWVFWNSAKCWTYQIHNPSLGPLPTLLWSREIEIGRALLLLHNPMVVLAWS
jgi:hypothetical protein